MNKCLKQSIAPFSTVLKVLAIAAAVSIAYFVLSVAIMIFITVGYELFLSYGMIAVLAIVPVITLPSYMSQINWLTYDKC